MENWFEKRAALILMAVLIILGFIAIFALEKGHTWGDDFAMYILQAQAITHFDLKDLMEKSGFCFANSETFIGPLSYPWGFPCLLSIIVGIFGLNLFAMKVYMILFFLLGLLVTAIMFKNSLGTYLTILLIGCLGLNPFMLQFVNNILSDYPYFFFSLLAVYLIQRMYFERKDISHKIFDRVLIGAIIFSCYSIRSNGIVLLSLLFIVQCVELEWCNISKLHSRIWKSWFEILPYIIFGLAVIISNQFLPQDITHVAILKSLNTGLIEEIVTQNIVYYFVLVLPTEFFHGKYAMMVYLITVLLVLIGLTIRAKKDYHYFIFMASTLGVYLIWPSYQGLRYFIPLLPFYLYFFFYGVKYLSELIRPKNKLHLLPAAVGLCLLVYFSSGSLPHLKCAMNENAVDGPFDAHTSQMTNFLIKYTSKDSIYFFFKPRILMLLTNHKAALKSQPADMAYFQPSYGIFLKPLNGEMMYLWRDYRIAFENEKYVVYKVSQSDNVPFNISK